MSNVPLVLPEDARDLLDRGYTFVDVRSEPEFLVGHVPGALNVPLQRVEGDRLVDNPDFSLVMSALFRTGDPLIIGCHSGGRSRAAVKRLSKAGFSALVELAYGFAGARDDFGRRLPGWQQRGLPVEAGASADGSYEQLRLRAAARTGR